MAATTTVNLTATDIQFGDSYDAQKMRRLVDEIGAMVSGINTLGQQVQTLENAGVATTQPHVLATTTGLLADHTVSGLSPGQVLIATSPTEARFAALEFGQLANTDPATFESPEDGWIIEFVGGFWSAVPNTGGGLPAAPGAAALLGWKVPGGGADPSYQWYALGTGLKFIAGAQLAVDPTQIDHNSLENLTVGNPHPQYAQVNLPETVTGFWSFTQQTVFDEGLISDSDIDLFGGNFNQAGVEPLQSITDNQTDDPEGSFGWGAAPGQLWGAALNADGSQAENWVTVNRWYAQDSNDTADVIEQVNFQGDRITANGFVILTALTLSAGFGILLGVSETGVQVSVAAASTLSNVVTQATEQPRTIMQDTQATDFGWQWEASEGLLQGGALNSDGSVLENWVSVESSADGIQQISFNADYATLNGANMLTEQTLLPGANVFFTRDTLGRLLVNSATGTGGGSTGANPTAVVGLTAVNGVATTFLRSDGAPALSQAISPTWTGNHTFTPASGVAAVINEVVGSDGLQIFAGSGSATDRSLNVVWSGHYNMLNVFNDGHGLLGFNGIANTITWAATGAVAIAAPPTAVTALTIGGNSGAFCVELNSTSLAGIAGFNTAGSTRTGFLAWVGGTGGSGGATECFLGIDATTTSDRLSLGNTNTGNRYLIITGGGGVTINAPTASVDALQVTGLAGQSSVVIVSQSTTTLDDLLITRPSTTANTVGQGANIVLQDNTGPTTTLIQQAGGQTEFWQFNGAWREWMKVGTSANPTITTAVSGQIGLVVAGAGAAAIYTNTTGIVCYAMNAAGANFSMLQNDGTQLWSIAAGPSLSALGTPILQWTGTGNITMKTPSSGATLNIGVLDNLAAIIINETATVSAGFYVALEQGGTLKAGIGLGSVTGIGATAGALNIVAGYASSADFLNFSANGGSAIHMQIKNTGQVSCFEPSFGLNALEKVATVDGATFTGTLTGMTATTTGTVNYVRTGSHVILYVTAAITGTSNATTMTMTGLPAEIRPSNAQFGTMGIYTNSGTPQLAGSFSIAASGSTITFGLLTPATAAYGNAFTNSGTKGLSNGWAIWYSLS